MFKRCLAAFLRNYGNGISGFLDRWPNCNRQ